MATITGTIEDFGPVKMGVKTPLTTIQFVDGEVAASGFPRVVRPREVIRASTPGSAGTIMARSMRSASSGVSTYRSMGFLVGLGTRYSRSNTATIGQTTLIDHYVTAAGYMDGVEINPMSTFSWAVSAKVSNLSNIGVIEMRFRHRTTGGSLSTFLTVETGTLTTSFFTYTGTATGFSQSWDTNETLVAEYYIRNDGVPP